MSSVGRGIQDGDWLWTTGVNGLSEKDDKDEIYHFSYALRPAEGVDDVSFQLVTMVNGTCGQVRASNFGQDTRGLAVQVQADFTFV